MPLLQPEAPKVTHTAASPRVPVSLEGSQHASALHPLHHNDTAQVVL